MLILMSIMTESFTVSVSLGFATLENILYLFTALSMLS